MKTIAKTDKQNCKLVHELKLIKKKFCFYETSLLIMENFDPFYIKDGKTKN